MDTDDIEIEIRSDDEELMEEDSSLTNDLLEEDDDDDDDFTSLYDDPYLMLSFLDE
jgi:hypothetical protein